MGRLISLNDYLQVGIYIIKKKFLLNNTYILNDHDK